MNDIKIEIFRDSRGRFWTYGENLEKLVPDLEPDSSRIIKIKVIE